ncbi:hypothetical protein [Nonomuraea basaltis]|uniref:hypothetical protein n=1 Tax=Nonomuraea basaltis TaxID=2495887 RepID=UPI00110C6B29|nr:hypothetical protein [Nonomuraea basaltis]TMR99558.1 hypothetical protein EJK15_07025 [Nonomuraea basaltis]
MLRQVVTFRSPRWRAPRYVMVLDQPLPKNTMDDRYDRCEFHHLACVCREAEQAEELSELQGELRQILTVLREELADHATWAYGPQNEDDLIAQCKCFGCKIARRLYHTIGGEIITHASRRGQTR